MVNVRCFSRVRAFVRPSANYSSVLTWITLTYSNWTSYRSQCSYILTCLREVFSFELVFSRSLIVWRLSHFNGIGRSRLALIPRSSNSRFRNIASFVVYVAVSNSASIMDMVTVFYLLAYYVMVLPNRRMR